MIKIKCVILIVLISIGVYFSLLYLLPQAVLVSHRGYIFEIPPLLKFYIVQGEILNTGFIPICNIKVTVSFYSQSTLIVEITDHAYLKYLLPNRKTPFTIPLVDYPYSWVTHYEINIAYQPYFQRIDLGFHISVLRQYFANNFLVTEGRVFNIAKTSMSNINIFSTFYDVNGSVAYVSRSRKITKLEPQEHVVFEIPLVKPSIEIVSYCLTGESELYGVFKEIYGTINLD